jgi:hypothetical protein
VHDTWDLDKVYSVLDFRAAAESDIGPIALQQYISASTDAELDRLRRIFWTLDQAGPKPTGLNADEQRIFDLYRADTSPTKFRDAADPIRSAPSAASREVRERAPDRARLPPGDGAASFRAEGLPGRADASAVVSRASTSRPTRRSAPRASGSSCRRPVGSTHWT